MGNGHQPSFNEGIAKGAWHWVMLRQICVSRDRIYDIYIYQKLSVKYKTNLKHLRLVLKTSKYEAGQLSRCLAGNI